MLRRFDSGHSQSSHSRRRSRNEAALRHEGAYARVVPRFIHQALKGENITVFGDGKQTRSFCYITGTISGILKIASNPKAKGEVFKIGNPEEITIQTLAEKVKTLTNSTSKIVHKPLPEDDPKRRCPDIGKARNLLDWSPRVGLEEGLQRTIEMVQDIGRSLRHKTGYQLIVIKNI